MMKLTVADSRYGGIAQLARAFGSYPKCRRFKSHYRYLIYGPVVKRLRHRPFTAVTRVRFPSGSLSARQGTYVLCLIVFVARKSILKLSMSKFSDVLWKCTNSFSRWTIWQRILLCRHAPSVKSWTTSCCSIHSLREEKYGISEDNLPAFATSLTEGGLSTAYHFGRSFGKR